jgi:hypothetical protein
MATCSGNLQLQLTAKPEPAVFSIDAAGKVGIKLVCVIQQSAWLAQYGGLVGQLQQELRGSVGAAAKSAFKAALRPPVQLRVLRLLKIQNPARLLTALDPSRLTAVHVMDAEGACTAQSALACAALARLTGLQQLSSSSCYPLSHSINAIGPAPLRSGRKREHCSLQQL